MIRTARIAGIAAPPVDRDIRRRKIRHSGVGRLRSIRVGAAFGMV
jgi:hypothetical protein